MTIYKCFTTLLYSWGSDTPPEATWAANDFLKLLSATHKELIGLEFKESYSDADCEEHNEAILNILKSLN